MRSVLYLLLLLPSLLFSQSSSNHRTQIKGLITDKSTCDKGSCIGLDSVLIKICYTGDTDTFRTYSDSAGAFIIKLTKTGTCTLICSRNGYSPSVVKGIITKDNYTTYIDHIQLAPIGYKEPKPAKSKSHSKKKKKHY